MGNPPAHPRLDGHGVLGFDDGEHFARVVESELLHGRAMVQAEAALAMHSSLRVHIQAPGTGQRLDLGARVVFAQAEIFGLEFTDLDAPRKELLRSMVATAQAAESSPPDHTAPDADAEPPAAKPTKVTPSTESAPSALAAFEWKADQLRVSDPGFLLALYLQALKGPPLDLGAPQPTGPRSLELHLGDQRGLVEAIILEGGRVDIPDPSPFVPLLEKQTAALARLLAPVGLIDGTTDIEAGGLAAELLPTPKSKPSPGDGPPRMPKLDGESVVFERMRDMEHERDVNVRNGGLFVESAPLPLRRRLSLRFRIGGRDLGFALEADVVFADAGRVGFSFTQPAEALRQFQRAEVPASKPRSSSQITTTDVSRVSGSRDLPAFNGDLSAPLPLAKLLELSKHSIRSTERLGRASSLLLFEFLAREKQTGVLEIHRAEGTSCQIYFYQGDVAFVEVKPFEESVSLGRILIAQKKVNETGLREALERARGSHRLLGRMLILLGIIKRGELVAALREQCRAKIDATFGWSAGRYAWGPWRDPPGEADLVVTRSLGVLARHVRVLLEHTSGRDLELLFGSGMAGVMVVQDLDRLATTLQLQPKELRFLELQLDGKRSVHDAVTGSPIGRLGALRLLATCLALGLARFTDDSQSMDLEDSAGPASGSKEADLEAQLQEELTRLEGSNHFDVLGVHWSSHQRSYREAWERRRSAYDRKNYAEAPEKLEALAAKIRACIDAAYEAIKSEGPRSAYRRRLFDSTERQYAADMLVKQGEIALMRGDRVRALESFETALELHPSQKVKALLTQARENR
ncbi:MAG: DUF4388 domain-containing protein [Myxococcota bacterium]